MSGENDKLPPVVLDPLTARPNSRSYQVSTNSPQQTDNPETGSTANDAPTASSAQNAGEESKDQVNDMEKERKYSKAYIKEWNITAWNLEEKLQEVADIITQLKETDMVEIVRNPLDFKHDILYVNYYCILYFVGVAYTQYRIAL